MKITDDYVFPLSPTALAKALQDIDTKFGDYLERNHIYLDDMIEAQLRSLGYSEAMDIYEAADKWYS